MTMASQEFIEDYVRILPRDFFNEGNLITNYGRLWILLDETNGHNARIDEMNCEHFDIKINSSTGGIAIANITFTIAGVHYYLERPMNSREKWPLMVYEKDNDDDFESVEIFDDDGNFTREMIDLITA